jgi:alpha-glucuronidase
MQTQQGLGLTERIQVVMLLVRYAPELHAIFGSREACPEKYLLWFHHVGWNETLKSGNTLWEELCFRYYRGVTEVEQMEKQWELLKDVTDGQRFKHVSQLLKIQHQEAVWWRNACVLYFQTFSNNHPSVLPKPDKTLDYYMSLEFPYAPGIKPQW